MSKRKKKRKGNGIKYRKDLIKFQDKPISYFLRAYKINLKQFHRLLGFEKEKYNQHDIIDGYLWVVFVEKISPIKFLLDKALQKRVLIIKKKKISEIKLKYLDNSDRYPISIINPSDYALKVPARFIYVPMYS